MAIYFRIGLDEPVSAFDICQAHQQLEADYNVGGWLRERPSNQRRREATSVQLARMGYSDSRRWVEIYPDADDDAACPSCGEDGGTSCGAPACGLLTGGDEDPGDDHVRQIYMRNVLRWKLPIAEGEKAFMRSYWAEDFLRQYPWVFESGDFNGKA